MLSVDVVLRAPILIFVSHASVLGEQCSVAALVMLSMFLEKSASSDAATKCCCVIL